MSKTPSTPLPEPRKGEFKTRPRLTLAVMGIGGLLLTLLLWQLTLSQSRTADKIRFEKLAGTVHETIKYRLQRHESALEGIKGLFAASKSVERGEFREYVKSIDLPTYRGALGFGFVRYVPRENLESFLARTRTDEAPAFTLGISSQYPALFITEYIEPLASNQPAQGLDIGAEPFRREAAIRAVETNAVTLTQKISLVQDLEKRPGFLLLRPIFVNGGDIATPAARWRSLTGWVYSPIRIDGLLEDIVEVTGKQVDFELFEDDASSRAALIYDADNHLAGSTAKHITEADFTNRLFHQKSLLVFGGRPWVLHTSTRSEFSAGTDQRLSWSVLIGGLICTVLLTYAANASQQVRKKALTLAEEMTLELREENLMRQKLHATLSKVSHFQEAILDSAAYAIISSTPEGVIRVFNPAAQRMLGYTEEEIVGRQTPAIFHVQEEVNARAKEFSAELGCTVEAGFDVFVIKSCRGLHNEHEWTYVRKDGTKLPVMLSVTAIRDELGNFTGYLGMAVDISERKLAWEALLQSRQASDEARRELELQRDALDQHAIVSITDPLGKILHVNDRFLAISGYKRDELIGQTHQLLNSGVHPPEFWQDFWKIIAAGNVWHGEICNRSKSGGLSWMSATVVPFHDANGEISRFVGIRTEITARKEAETALLEAKKIAEDANQSKSEFLAEMSHEIRTPMNAVLGFTELLATTPLNDKQRSFVDTIQFSGQNLLTIINDILDYSKIEAGKLDVEKLSVDAVGTAEAVIKTLSLQANKQSLSLTLRALPTAPRLVTADPTRVRQVLTNLIGNALKFTKKGGVTVTLETVMAEGQSRLRINVSDTGIGLSPAQQAKLFAKYSQAKASTTREFGGTGLGLAICKRLVELMGGTIGVTSIEGQGSTFWFTLPLAGAGVALVAPRRETSGRPTTSPAGVPPAHFVSASPPTNPARSFHVLVADDNPINRQLACAFLAKLNCQSSTAGNGAEAAAMVQQQSFDLVLMDYQMPEMNGMQATTAIRHWESAQSGRKRLPIVALTANLSPEAANNFLACGMDACLGKPLMLAELRSVIENLTHAPIPAPPSATVPPVPAVSEKKSANASAMNRTQALSLTDNNPALLGMLAQAFLAQCDDLLGSIRRALQARDEAALKAHAHKLKGSISVFAADDAQAIVLALNKFSTPANWTQLDQQGQQLEIQIARLKPELLALTTASSTPPA